MARNYFVFAVCGTDEHIQTLNYSLRALKVFGATPIIVVTDLKRNTTLIEHDVILDSPTPSDLNHHQASIFLKTSLHRLLPLQNTYCYLDSDVVAVSERVDEIFRHKYNLITFAPDHCTMNKFSPMAVRCNCVTHFQELREKVEVMRRQYEQNYQNNKEITIPLEQEWKMRISKLSGNRWANFAFALKYMFMPGKIWLDEDFYLDRQSNCWNYKNGHAINYDYDLYNHIGKALDLSYINNGQYWQTREGLNIYLGLCNHLQKAIEKKFGITVAQENWQHWNGGVFLFDQESHDFMDTWHAYTMEIFNDPYWNTRDQGTLIATAWKYNLQYSNPLIKEFNFIADPNNSGTQIIDENTFTDDDGKTFIQPAFVHLYHNFGDAQSPYWKWTESKVNMNFG